MENKMERIRELVKQLNEYNYYYYVMDDPILSSIIQTELYR